ncbi:MAG: hypothetical protein P8Y53_19950, partial [Pseudolabrys sp.]
MPRRGVMVYKSVSLLPLTSRRPAKAYRLRVFPMFRPSLLVFVALFVSLSTAASAQTASFGNPGHAGTPQMVVTAPPTPAMRSDYGGGFIEFLFGGGSGTRAARPRARYYGAPASRPFYANVPVAPPPVMQQPSAHPPIAPRF